MIEFKNVSKKFGDGTYGISDITVHIPDGDFVFLVGQSGAGKTTLLKLLTGQMKATEGTIIVDEIDVTKLKPSNIHKLRRKIGVVFQDFKLLQDQTIYENVALALEVMGQNEKKYKNKILDILQKVGLAGKERYFPALEIPISISSAGKWYNLYSTTNYIRS
jgi:cell division transport system ATP-binding protein